jgi:hypothetical protein
MLAEAEAIYQRVKMLCQPRSDPATGAVDIPQAFEEHQKPSQLGEAVEQLIF